MSRNLPHIKVPTSPAAEPYTPHAGGRTKRPPVPGDPEAHARALRASLEKVEKDALARRNAAAVSVTGATPGLGVVFSSPPNIKLDLEKLDLKQSKIELLSARTVKREDGSTEERATVFIPDGKAGVFLKKFDDYVAKSTPKGHRKNSLLVDTLTSIQLATLSAFWTDETEFPADAESIWWEVWLRTGDGKAEARFLDFAKAAGIEVGGRRLTFPDRIVRTAHASPAELGISIDVIGDIAELRRARDAPGAFVKMKAADQGDWVRELATRLTHAPPHAPAVCIIDTGVNRGHPLLEGSLDDADTHAADPVWGKADHEGHGTQMAGLALVGDLRAALLSTAPLALAHRLESTKVLPPVGATPPELWGDVTAAAVAQPELTRPRARVYSMSIASDATDQGRPTSWSAAIDGLAAGRALRKKGEQIEMDLRAGTGASRLLVVCAGNVNTPDVDHISRSDIETIRDPGQAWNALTVGACTHLVELDQSDASLRGHHAVAPLGDLSPYSSTSVGFSSPWPLKPDVVFEGGNKVHDGHAAFEVEDLSLPTTNWKPAERLLERCSGTSAATAQVAGIAARVTAAYPSLWPETVRALVVHSAEWTHAMRTRTAHARKRAERERELLRRYGFGMPSAERATKSAKNALTLVVEDSVRPFHKGKLREMKVHELPWPKDALLELAETPVTLRVTLSYFIEPNPGRRGWRTRYRYASHGLRFDVMKPTEEIADFRKRLNKLAATADEGDDGDDASKSDAQEWFLGPDVRHHGSLHGDIWVGTGSALAARGAVGVFPVTGWWKDQPKHDLSEKGLRYALVVSITTPETEVDLWTPVATEVGVVVAAVAET